MHRHKVEELAISVITAMELELGLAKRPTTKIREAVRRFLSTVIIAPLPDRIAPVYGSIRAHLEAHGTPIGALDTIIAAHAVAQGYTLVTANLRELKRVPSLKCEDWS